MEDSNILCPKCGRKGPIFKGRGIPYLKHIIGCLNDEVQKIYATLRDLPTPTANNKEFIEEQLELSVSKITIITHGITHGGKDTTVIDNRNNRGEIIQVIGDSNIIEKKDTKESWKCWKGWTESG